MATSRRYHRGTARARAERIHGARNRLSVPGLRSRLRRRSCFMAALADAPPPTPRRWLEAANSEGLTILDARLGRLETRRPARGGGPPASRSTSSRQVQIAARRPLVLDGVQLLRLLLIGSRSISVSFQQAPLCPGCLPLKAPPPTTCGKGNQMPWSLALSDALSRGKSTVRVGSALSSEE